MSCDIVGNDGASSCDKKPKDELSEDLQVDRARHYKGGKMDDSSRTADHSIPLIREMGDKHEVGGVLLHISPN
jgi:hypothetical protein